MNSPAVVNQDPLPLATDSPTSNRLLLNFVRRVRHRHRRHDRLVRRVFAFDLDLRDRVFEPYVLFKDKQGRVMVGGRRVLDENDLFKPPAMRQFEVGLVNNLEVTEETFEVDPGFSSKGLSVSSEILEAADRKND